MIDWKKKYEELAKLSQEFRQKLRETEYLQSRIDMHVAQSRREDLRERGVHRFLRLKETITIPAIYNEGSRYNVREVPRTFEAGTLVEAVISGNTANVYLDDDGDGMLYFPVDKLEEVELPDDQVDWNKVVSQG